MEIYALDLDALEGVVPAVEDPGAASGPMNEQHRRHLAAVLAGHGRSRVPYASASFAVIRADLAMAASTNRSPTRKPPTPLCWLRSNSARSSRASSASCVVGR